MSTSSRLALPLTLFAAVVGVATFSPDAQAQTSQVVQPNSSCAWQNNEPIGRTYADGWVHFLPTAWELAICGVDRFNLTNTNGLRDLDVRLNNMDDVPASTTCTLMAMRPDGSYLKTVSMAHTFVGAYRMDFGGSLNQSVAYGAYAVECALPPATVLVNILQREY